jgi:hypothetical protein
MRHERAGHAGTRVPPDRALERVAAALKGLRRSPQSRAVHGELRWRQQPTRSCCCSWSRGHADLIDTRSGAARRVASTPAP